MTMAEILLLLNALERLISLLKIRNARLQARFGEIYKPAFHDLRAVHTDYLAMFTELEVLLERLNRGTPGTDPRVREAIEFLRTRRVQLEPVRAQLVALKGFLEGDSAKGLSREEISFLYAVADFIGAGGVGQARSTTRATTILEYMEDEMAPRIELASATLQSPQIERVSEECQRAMTGLRNSWDRAIERFNALRLLVVRSAT